MTDPWLRDVPAVFRALADRRLESAIPPLTSGTLDHACAYWGALHYTLSSLLGWSDVSRGLAWWYAAGKPVDDSPVLALVQRVWGADDLIDYYAAWTWKPHDVSYFSPTSVSSLDAPSPSWLASHSAWKNEAWWRTFIRRGKMDKRDPFYGGSDSLHLSAHDGPPTSEPSAEPLVHLIPEQRRILLVTQGLDHWLADLRAIETRLPPVGDRSWRVEVFERCTGYLGEYRRSRVTGRWFTGRHALHMRGNDPHNCK